MLKGQLAEMMVTEAIALGFRHIDTAQLYDNELAIGNALQRLTIPRADLFITTKVWWTNLAPDLFLPSVEASLKRLQLDYIDLLLIHWPHPEIALDIYLPELMKAQEKGYAQHIGVSNFNVAMVEESLRLGANIITNQVEYHPFLSQEALLECLHKHNIWLTAYSPVAQGKVGKDPLLQEIGARYEKSPFQVSIKWLLQQNLVAAIPRTSSIENLKLNFDVFDFELNNEEITAIHQLGLKRQRLVDPYFAPAWD